MKHIGFGKIKTRLVAVFLLIALLPLLVGIMITYTQQMKTIRDEEMQKLTAIRDLKVQQVNDWIDERIGDIRIIATDNQIRGLEYAITNRLKSSDDMLALENAAHLLVRYINIYGAYSDIFILNAETGIVEVSTNHSHVGDNRSGNSYYTETLKRNDVFIKDIHQSTSTNMPSMNFAFPIHSTESGKLFGIAVSRVNLKDSLYLLLLNRTGMGRTGETLIVNKDGYALNELRWYENAPLRLKIKAEPAVNASQGITGIGPSEDYRGVPILTAYTHIPKTGWGFVAKQDQSELNEPIKDMVFDFFILFAVSAVVVCLAALFLASKISGPVMEMTQVSKQIQAGNLDIRNVVRSNDEFGFLAQSFNSMADSISSQLSIQRKETEISEIMVHANTIDELAKDLVDKMTDITGSCLGVFYLMRNGSTEYAPVVSVGANSDLPVFSCTDFEGQFGKALLDGRITHLTDIGANTVFTFRTIAGTAFPSEMITIPLSIEKITVAIIALATLGKYSKDCLTVLNNVWAIMETSLANLLANEATKRLANELQEKNTELESQSLELRRQSEELKEQNIELEMQREQIMAANRLKSEFLSNMSHELRTPLNSVNALSRVLILQAAGKLDKEEANYLEIIERNGKHLLSLINDILDLSKIESGKMELIAKPFSLKTTIENIVETLEPIADEKGVRIDLNIPDDVLQIESDESRVHQILQNVIGNGVKFTNRGCVTVSVSVVAENFQIDVEDTGIGISAKDIGHIFEEFRQADGTSSRQFEGTGLGLTISQKASRMIGGEITVKSVPGMGSIFTVTLPVKWKDIQTSFEPIRNFTKISEGTRTILVVDDDPDVVGMISEFLSDEGYETITATSGKHALELAETYRPFAITLDVIMPEMDGWEVLQNLKMNPSTAGIPVIVVSVSKDKETGFALGAIGYVAKPVDRNRLISEIYRIHRAKPFSVLVVDDNNSDRKMAARILEEDGIKTFLAEGGNQCIKMIQESGPDIVVLDLMMPDVDGFEVLERIRQNPATVNLPVIIVTAKYLTAQERKWLQAGTSSILTKGEATSRDLLEEIRKIIKTLEKEAVPANRILLVEDNEAAIIQVKNALGAEGYHVDLARNGEQALAYVSHTIPTGIVLDLMMPGIDGFEVLEMIRGTQATKDIPVLILTAKDLTSDDLKRLKSNDVQQLVQKGNVDREGLIHKTIQMLSHKTFIQAPKPDIVEEKKMKTTSTVVLAIEDNPDNMTTIKAILRTDYEVMEATDGEEGLEKAFMELPDLILLDMSLPKMDGFTLARKIRENKRTRKIPVIALTARAMKGDRENIIAAGCDDYVSKPVDPEGLIRTIKKWTEKQKR